MKVGKLIPLAIIAVFLTAWTATAYEPQTGKGPFGARNLTKMQKKLDLTDDQATSMLEILASGKQGMTEIMENNGLERSDMRMMHRELRKLRPQGMKKLATVLSQEQLVTLREEISIAGPFKFIQISTAETMGHLQNSFGLTAEEADQLETIVEETKAQYEQVLENLDINPGVMMAFQQDMAIHQQEMENSLSEVLSGEQMSQYKELRSWKKHRNRGPGRNYNDKGDQL